MADIFIKILNMSISACWLILAVLILRIALRKAPKWVRVLLWGIVAVRLLCPVTIESVISLIPSAETINPAIVLDPTPAVTTGFATIDAVIDPMLSQSSAPTPMTSANPLQIWFAIAANIWLLGILAMLIYTLVSYLLLRKKVATAVAVSGHIYQSENVGSPFVLGIFKPKIYLPFHISEQNIEHVIAHEQAHIRRKDHWWKPLGFLLLTLHWYNPLMWLAYVLLCRDIELACDEKVIKDLGTDARADYSAALLSCSVNRHMIAACPIAFGEVSVKTRIKSVLNYKKPAFWIVVVAVVVCCAVAVCFLTDPVGSSREPDLSFLNYENVISLVADREEVQVIYCPSSQGDSDHTINVGTVSGRDLALYLDDRMWKVANEPNYRLSSPGSVEFVIGEDHRIQVYERKGLSFRAYAVVTYAEETRYYAIKNSDYQDAVDLLYAPVLIHEDNLWSVTRTGDSYYLTVGSEGVSEIGIKTPTSGGGCVHADGSPYRVGEQVWLDHLEGFSNLSNVEIEALDEHGNMLYMVILPEEADRNWASNMVQYRAEQSVIFPTNKWIDGIAFVDLEPNKEQTSDFEILLENESNSLQYNITWSRTGLTLEYGLRSSDGVEYFNGHAGGQANGQIDKIPAGTYRLFVRNTDYTGVHAYDNPEAFPYVSLNATGAINFRIP